MAMPETLQARYRQGQIAHASARLFAENGYFETTMDDVADAVGLAKASLYHYVRSKGEIVCLIHNGLADYLIGKLEARIASELPLDVLHGVFVDIVEAMDSHPGHLKVYFEYRSAIPDAFQADARARRDRYWAIVQSVIDEAVSSGQLQTDNARLTSLAIFGMCNWSYQWYKSTGEMSPSIIADHFWDIFYRGVGVHRQ